MELGLHNMKQVRLYDFISLYVPERWDGLDNDGRYLVLFEDSDVHSGNLTVGYDTLRDPNGSDVPEDAWMSETRTMAMNPIPEPEGTTRALPAMEVGPGHFVQNVTYLRSGSEEGEPGDYCSMWMHTGILRPCLTNVFLTLTICRSVIDDPEIDDFLGTMDNVLLNTRFDWERVMPGEE